MDYKNELKQGDFVVVEIESTKYYAICRYHGWTRMHNVHGAPEYTAVYGGHNGEMELVVYDGYAGEQWNYPTRLATDEERKRLEDAIAEKEIAFDGEFYHKPQLVDVRLSSFGDKFLTKGGHNALFLRRASNAENDFAFIYVQGWGQLQYYLDGRCVERSMPYYDIAKKVINFRKED